MKKLALTILALAMILACGSLVVQAENKTPATPRDTSQVVSKEFKLNNFETVDVSGGMTIIVKQGQPAKVLASCNQNSINKLLISVDKNILTIRTAKNYNASHAKIIVSAPTIKTINSSGAASVVANQINGDFLKISSHNNSTVKSTGSVQTVVVNGDGRSFLNLENLRSKDCVAVVADEACAKVFASNTLKATASGKSVINVKGNPRILKRAVANSSILKLSND